MKKHLFSTFTGIILLAVGLTLTSCENFMQGADVRNQLDKAVSFANAKNCSLFISQETEMGTFLSSGEKECKVGYTVDIVFYLNKDYYVFKNLKAVSVTDESQSRDDCVEFTINEQESDIEKGLYRITAKLLKNVNDIMIKPDCITLPRVVSYQPASKQSNYTNTSIIIEFNLSMDPQIIKNNLSLKFNDVERSQEWFYEPLFSNDNKVITIQPKAIILSEYINSLNADSIDVKVLLPETIVVTEDNTTLSLVQDMNSAFSVKFNQTVEKTKPVKKELFLTRHEIELSTVAELIDNTDEHFNKENIAEPPSNITNNVFLFKSYSNNVLQNRTGGTVYIYGEYSDKDSGIKTVTIEEQRTNGWNSRRVKDDAKISVFTALSDDVEFNTVDDITTFCIPYQITSGDGAVQLRIKVSDTAGNYDEIEQFTAIKKSSAVITNVHEFGTAGSTDTGEYYPENDSLFDKLESRDISITEYNQALRTIKDTINCEDSIEENEICTLYLLDSYGIGIYMYPKEVRCEYVNKSGKPSSKILTMDDYWTDTYQYYIEWHGYTTLDDVDSMAGLPVTFIVTDDLGNTAEKQIRLPSSKDLELTIEKDSGEATVTFKNTFPEPLEDIIQAKFNEDGTIKEFIPNFDNNNYLIGQTTIESGYNYKMSACINGFLTEFDNDYYSMNSANSSENLGEVIISKDQNGNKQYSIEKATERICKSIGPWLNIIIPISSESVEKYDSIYARYTYGVKQNSLISVDGIAYAENGSGHIIVQIPTKSFWDDNVSITLYGVLNQSTTAGTDDCCKLKINKFALTTAYDIYDNTVPVFEHHFGSSVEEKLIFGIRTLCASPIIIQMKFDDRDAMTYSFTSTGWPSSMDIPYYEFVMYGQEAYIYTCSIIKRNGVTDTLKQTIFFYDYPSGSFTSIEKKDGYWNLITDGYGTVGFGDVDVNDIYVYTLETKNNVTSWKDETPSKTGWKYYTSGTSEVITTVEAYNLPQNQYIRIITSLNDAHSVPAYLYTGTPGTGNKDLFLPGGFENTYAIASDAPVFVHTLVTDRPYEECKDWSSKEWEYYKKHLGEQVLTFASNNTGVQAYNAPVSSTNIKSGECYIVIAHYATGRIAKSPVMVKP